ncbi:calcium-binding protein [Pararhodobacter sp.]|uniref:EF-hand domain-containing protein n=1 Tax=Pararhodobacter sp. TaxID=2127056 RepID=UPI002AFF0479|nr:calcium-binding protein [Pararhodobacter sp.]
MKRTTTAALAIGTVFAIGALALPTLAQQAGHGHAAQDGETGHAGGQSGGHGIMPPQVMQTMMRMHSGGGMGAGMMDAGMMDGGMMDQMAEGADTDGNGVVSPEEMQASLTNRLAVYDIDGDGTLSLAEFEAMHAAMIRPMMVDRFQSLDEDGDGQVTSDEMIASSEQMQRMMQRRAQLGDGHGRGGGRMMTDN